MAVDHYENFPVASLLLPTHLRRPVKLIYRFARNADDFADEGDLPVARRLELLAGYHAALDRIERNESVADPLFEPLFEPLAAVIREYQLPISLFKDLLSAFQQDVTQNRYADFGEVLQYCKRSANPIGRLLLYLFGVTDARSLAYSDNICSGLQITNFLQDIAIDYAKGRIYLPQDEMRRYGISETDITEGTVSTAWRSFMRFQIERTCAMMQAGAPLGTILTGRIGLEIRMTIAGGERILKKLQDADGDIFRQRPVLQSLDWLHMIRYALFASRSPATA
jgi:squalene synthase HpnC